MMRLLKTSLLLLALLIAFSGCAALDLATLEQPQVNVSSFRMLPTNSLVPEFEIGLHVINPNRVPLKLFGMSYEIELEGHRVLTGVANDLPLIAAYGEGDVLLQARPDLFSTISLFTDLMNQPREKFNFKFTARLDIGKLLPKIQVSKEGQIGFPAANR
jgi:LEA14-like dessication related protein